MFTNETAYVATGINDLIANTNRVHVLFATYNNVADYGSGPVDTKKEGLTIQVQNGDLEYSPITDLVFLFGTPFVEIGGAAMDKEARDAQSALEASLAIEHGEDASLIAIVYAGLSAFDEALDFGRRVKKDQPTAKVIIVTCNCHMDHKGPALEPLLQNKELEAVIVTDECGGRRTMRGLLEGFVTAWPNNVLAATMA